MAEISVIVPVYKVEPYLRACIDSILSQSYCDFECVLVDDGSPDNCGAICDEYASKDRRIHVIHQNNGGLSVARNTGIDWTIQNSNAQWICFVDSDDVLSDCYLERLLYTAVKKSALISACAIRRFRGNEPQKAVIDGFSEDEISILESSQFLNDQMTRKIEMGVVNRLFHISVFDDIRFFPGRLHEDIFFAADLLEKKHSVAFLNQPLYYYRQRKNSIMKQQKAQRTYSPDRIIAANYLLKKAEKSGFPFMDNCFKYAVSSPWHLVDNVYVDFSFSKNKGFLKEMQIFIREYEEYYQALDSLSEINRKRMKLFSKSPIMYGFNAYARLLRVYLYHILRKNPYKDGHGI